MTLVCLIVFVRVRVRLRMRFSPHTYVLYKIRQILIPHSPTTQYLIWHVIPFISARITRRSVTVWRNVIIFVSICAMNCTIDNDADILPIFCFMNISGVSWIPRKQQPKAVPSNLDFLLKNITYPVQWNYFQKMPGLWIGIGKTGASCNTSKL